MNQYIEFAKETFEQKLKTKTVNILNWALRLSLAVMDVSVIQQCHILQGFVLFNFRDIPNAMQHFYKLRDIASEEDDYHTKLFAYKYLALGYSMEKDYENAIKCGKKMLELSWICQLTDFEVHAYEFLAI